VPDFLPTPQMPQGLAEETLRLAAARGENNPWVALAKSAGQIANAAGQAELDRRAKAATMLTPDQSKAIGINTTVPGPMPPGAQGPGQPINAFPKGVPMSLAENMLQRKTQEDIARETTSRALGAAGVKATAEQDKLNIPVTDTTKALFTQAGLPLSDDAKTVRHEDYEAALKKVLGDQANKGKKDAAAAKAGASQELNWQKFAKDADVAQASSRTLVGTAASINARADRSLQILKGKQVTNQQAAGIAADIAGILKGSTPDEQSMKEQGYGTLYSRAAGLAQYITGNPTDAVTEPIKKKLKDTILELKKVDNQILKNHADSLKEKYAPLFKADPERAKKIHGGVQKTTEGVADAEKAPQEMSDEEIKAALAQ
jgi:hypothetical protein